MNMSTMNESQAVEPRSFEQTKDILSEIVNVLDQEKLDVQTLQETGKLCGELLATQKQIEDIIKEDIRALCQCKEEREAEIKTSEENEKLEREEEKLKEELKQSKEHIENVSKQADQLKAQVNASKEEKDRLTEERRRIKKKTTETLPSVRHTVSLFHNVTKISWQYDTQPQEVKGFITNKSEVKPFSLSNKENSKFFIANYLWDQMEVDW
ncbi:unnamed protein product [Owenia fusiformis]|uniref:Kinetochore protein Spc24 n=1 Tax=Owenia fusiformis TaxID=6347 RepID=A0A8J1U6D2_OWEFU|nr:unnamed protein product [Owenia fusiformis]